MFLYLMISGAAVPTERAFVMNGIVFAAMLIDRLRISMRICALAAVLVLVIEPGEPGRGQLSDVVRRGRRADRGLRGVGRAAGPPVPRRLVSAALCSGYVGAVAATTVIATFGTEPFAIHHFHHFVLYSPLANVHRRADLGDVDIAVGLVACLLMPFGLEQIGLMPMGWGIDATIWIAQWVAGLPGNVWPTPRLPMYGLVLIALGGLWLCLWHGRWRVWGLAGIAAGFATMLLTRPPDIVLADLGRLLAARAADGELLRRPRRRKADALVPDARDRRGAASLAGGRDGGGERAALPERGAVLLYRQRSPGRAGHGRGRAAGRVRHGRCDRRAGAGRVRLPLADPDRGPDRQLAPGRLRAVARSRRHHDRERQCQPRRPALGAASGLGPGTRPPRQPEEQQEEAPPDARRM